MALEGDHELDPVFLKAINRGGALPIGSPQTGHIANCDEAERAANYMQPGQYGPDYVYNPDTEREAD